MMASAAALKKIADAADPLYKTLDDGQKRRLAMLTHHNRHGGDGEGWRGRLQHGFGGGRDPGPDSSVSNSKSQFVDRQVTEGKAAGNLRRLFRGRRPLVQEGQNRTHFPLVVGASWACEKPTGLLDIAGSLC